MISDKGSLFNVKGSRFNRAGSCAEDGLAFQERCACCLRAAKIFKAQEGSTAKTRLWQQLRGTRILVNLYGETNGSKFARGLIGISNCGE